MKNETVKQGIISLALTVSLFIGIGAVTAANAQGRYRRVDPQNNGQVDRNGNIDRNRNGIDDRYEVNGQVDINRNGIPDNQEGYNRNRGYNNNGYYGNRDYRNNGYYGNRGYGMNNGEFQQGYRDGLNRGREDALTNRAMNPNNSSHYRNGDQSYRAGFERGFYEAYRANNGRRW